MAAPMRRFAAPNLLTQLQHAGRRSYATTRPSLIADRARWTSRPVSSQIALRQQVRRQFFNSAPKPRKRFSVLRWTWRLTYLSALAGLGYIGYGIYVMRNPEDQPDPDPNKKTLVILGE
jgi:NADH:ubiquinone reductase (non-electrogenic)